jgi:acyl CoA:acetate/3-ketoacid CoA transferase beta subunit
VQHPLTALRWVSRVCTDLAVLDTTPAGVRVEDLCEGLDRVQLQALTALP